MFGSGVCPVLERSDISASVSASSEAHEWNNFEICLPGPLQKSERWQYPVTCCPSAIGWSFSRQDRLCDAGVALCINAPFLKASRWPDNGQRVVDRPVSSSGNQSLCANTSIHASRRFALVPIGPNQRDAETRTNCGDRFTAQHVWDIPPFASHFPMSTQSCTPSPRGSQEVVHKATWLGTFFVGILFFCPICALRSIRLHAPCLQAPGCSRPPV